MTSVVSFLIGGNDMKQEKKWCVYIHIFPNNKSYIGITSKEPTKRWGKDGSGYLCKNKDGNYAQPLIARAILKYCRPNTDDWDTLVKHDILCDNLTYKRAGELEDLLIEMFQLRDSKFGYNINRGGNHGFSGRNHTDEAKEKNRIAHLRENLSEETLEKMSVAAKARVTEEFRELIREFNRNRIYTDEMRQKISEKHKGRTMSVEAREKIRQSHLGDKNPMFGKHVSDSAKKQISDALKIKYLGEGNPMYGKRGSLHHNSKPVCQFDDDWNLIRIFDCAPSATRETGVSHKNISSVCHEKRRRAGGYRWRLVYDCVLKDGITIPGAITLGLIAEEVLLCAS